MNLKEKKSIKAQIVEDIENLKQDIQKTEDKYTPISQDCSLDHINRKDMQIEQEINNKIIKEAQNRVSKLISTLKRVDNKEYGICKECDDHIALNRLMLLPESIYCVECMNELGI